MNQLLHFRKAAFVLVLLFEILSGSISANPGDTTWVTIWNQRPLTYYGNYDTSATLPTGKRYRKIRLHYILDRYACPPGTQYCGSWDYTTQIYARPQNNDSVEIARIITPYATNWLANNHKHDYIVEVTDYAPILDGSLGFRFVYQGYSFGFLVTVKLELIEGVPPMDALQIKNIYNGYFPYGNNANPIENYLTAKTFSYAPAAGKVFVKNFVSGHGSDDANCSEFCSKYYQLKLNNSQVAQYQIWRSNCGLNDEYPQTGTWLYERANWCPGAVVWPVYHDISSYTSPNTNFTVDIDMQPYSAPNQSNTPAGYNFISQLITYSVVNQATDVSIEDIIAPTLDENSFRSNPNCANPIIKIKNTGSNPVTQVVFSYGLQGAAPLTYTWTGSLNFLDETQVVFPPSVSIFTNNTASAFQVSVTAVNGNAGDQNLFNNIYSSKTSPVNVFPSSFVIKFLTNNATDPVTVKNETTWKLYDENGVIIKSRSNCANNTVFLDTVNLQPGCYKYVVDDSGCDGYNWWAYQYYNPNPGNGTLRFDYVGFNTTIINFQGDFGCGFVKYFRVANVMTSLKSNAEKDNVVSVFPNPAQNEAFIKFDLGAPQKMSYRIVDVTGKVLMEKQLNKQELSVERIDCSTLMQGVYFVHTESESGQKFVSKLVIQK
jgi:hypothetical protein